MRIDPPVSLPVVMVHCPAATDDPELARRVRALGNHGHVPGALHPHETISGHVGINSRLDSVQALVVTAHLADLSGRVEWRRAARPCPRAR